MAEAVMERAATQGSGAGKVVSVSDGRIGTFNGHPFDYTTADARWIDIETVAHSLSQICRFTGHCLSFYSVAQHCVLMSRFTVPHAHRLWALMHEAGEPLCSDLNKPLKLMLPDYNRVEGRVQREVLMRFGLDPDAMPKSIKRGDRIMLATEQRDLMPKVRAIGWDQWGMANKWEPIPVESWKELEGVDPLKERIKPWSPEVAKAEFLAEWRTLMFRLSVRQEGTLRGERPQWVAPV